jgi:hypothetical protein
VTWLSGKHIMKRCLLFSHWDNYHLLQHAISIHNSAFTTVIRSRVNVNSRFYVVDKGQVNVVTFYHTFVWHKLTDCVIIYPLLCILYINAVCLRRQQVNEVDHRYNFLFTPMSIVLATPPTNIYWFCFVSFSHPYRWDKPWDVSVAWKKMRVCFSVMMLPDKLS